MSRTTGCRLMVLAGMGLVSACTAGNEELSGVQAEELRADDGDRERLGDHRGAADECSFRRTNRTYGFQCLGSLNLGAGLVPASLVGVVSGDGRGGFAGRGTLSSPFGSLQQRLAGTATLSRDCFGRVTYDVNEIETAPGSGVFFAGPPIVIDYAVVDGGREILGAPVSDATGDLVPRMNCRLIDIRGHD